MKGLGRLWLRAAKKITKAQQTQQRKLVKSLIAPPKKKRAVPAKVATTVKRVAKAPRSPVTAVKTASVPLPGKWLSSFYVSAMDGTPVRRMQYWLYLPSTLSTASLPLVVMLHGCEQTAAQFAQGTSMNRLAEEKGFAVLYPQQSLSAHPNRCWTWYDKATQAGEGDVKLITGVISKVVGTYPVDTRRIYIAGMSAGAAMASIVALNHPHLIAAVGMHSGTVFGGGHSKMGALGVMQHGDLKPVGNAIDKVMARSGVFPVMPAMLIQGQADRIVRPVNLIQLTQQFRRLNRLADSAGISVMKPAGKARHNPAHGFLTTDYLMGRKPIVRACDIFHLDHAWSGGDATLRFNSSAGPNATKMLWSFFSKHRRTSA